MSVITDPTKTLAVVVGVEKYAIHPKWNLNGPASDAVHFVQWLRKRDVPKKNIRLFLSPLDENHDLYTQVDVCPQEAHFNLIQDTLANELPAMPGVLLYLFWGGHGVIEADQKRRLFCADVTKNNKLVISLDAVLAMLRSKPWSRLQYQIGIIDACANYYEEMRSNMTLANIGFSHGTVDDSVKQFILYAAAAGQRAQNKSIEKTGAFSEAILTLLEQDTSGQWPPDMPTLLQKIKEYFHQLRAAGKTRQVPVAYQWQDWEGNAGEGGTTLNEVVKRLQFTSEVRSLLTDLLFSTGKLQQHYLRSAPDFKRAPWIDNLDQAIEYLCDMAPIDIPPIFEFVERLGQDLGAHYLSSWVEHKAPNKQMVEDLRIRLQREAQAALQSVDYLMIDIPHPLSHQLEYWLLTVEGEGNAYHCVDHRLIDCQPTLAGVQEAVDRLYGKVANLGDGELCFELFVSEEFLHCKADQWTVTLDEENKRKIGEQHSIVLRWRKRILKAVPSARQWRKLGKQIRHDPLLSVQPNAHWIADGQQTRTALIAELSTGTYGACIGFLGVPINTATSKPNDLLIAVLHSGVPFALWSRCDTTDWGMFQQRLDYYIRVQKLDRIPFNLQIARLKEHVLCASLTVLWDDPERNPLEIQLMPVAQRS